MSGLSLADLPNPPLGYRPARNARGDGGVKFENIGTSRAWDEKFAGMLEQELPSLSPLKFAQAANLIVKLIRAVADDIPCRTMASSLYKRDVRNRAIGWVWYLLDQYPDEAKATATLIPATTFVAADDLHLIDPRLLMKQLRNEFNRCGVTDASGFLFVGLDVEFDVNRGCWHFHYHLAGAGDKVDALDGLRDFRRFKNDCRHPLENGMAKYDRVQVVRGPFDNEPASFTYVLKTYAQHRPTKIQPDGIRVRSQRGFQLPTPYYVQWLLWMDLWACGNLTLLSGLKIRKTGLQITSPHHS